jgi:hypothetical protein
MSATNQLIHQLILMTTSTKENHMYPQLFSMIAPNLFQGGTDDLDVIHLPVTNNRKRTDLPFDSIVTMYAWARPADWNVQEFRYGVRCQAGLNRSGLVTALLLIKDGHSPESAITMIRTSRGEDALFNTSFTDWLIAEAETFFNTSPSQQAA